MVDDARFERVYVAHGPAVLRYCTYSVGSQQIAEDVAAEVFARYLERGERLDDERVEAWLIRVARNLCASHHRLVARERRLLSRLDPVPDASLAWADRDWWDAVRALKEGERLVVYLRAVEDRSFSDIARVTRRGESAVKMTFYRAVEKLRRSYERSDVSAFSSVAGGVTDE
jgi:RNA polymerase sigma-70 factor (ECF subfamily)